MDRLKRLCGRYGTAKVSVAISMTLFTTLAAIMVLSAIVPMFGFVFGMALLITFFVVGITIVIYNLVEMALADDF